VTSSDRARSGFARRLVLFAAGRPLATGAAVVAVVVLPLVVAVVALHARSWYPVLDLAMTEFRVRDVGTDRTPLIGLPGRIGTYPDQGSHPGPLSFYLLAPTYRLFGSSSWALETATVAIHVAAVATAIWLGYRRLGWPGAALVALVMALVLRGYGQVALTQPWNPYLPLLAWMVVLLAAWSVLDGDRWMLVPLVVAASYGAQTHVPYLPLGVGMVTLGGGALLWTRRSPGPPVGRVLAVGLGLGAVLWLPPVVDQIRRRPGNMHTLVEHFGSPPDDPIGVGAGLRLALRHLDAWAGLAGQLTRTGSFIAPAAAWRGAVVGLAWLAAAAVAARIGSRALRALHGVVATGLVLGAVSMARIFGRPWYYLTLWAWSVTTLAVVAIAWTALVWWRRRQPSRAPTGRVLAAGLAGAAIVTSLASAVAFTNAHHPEERLSDAIGALSGDTYAAIVAGNGAAVGPDGRYLVRWSDVADIGSPGFGLLDELERRGLDVAADTYFHVPVTPARAEPRAWADAQIHLATGGYIEQWRAVTDAVEVVTYDPRSLDERAEYAAVRARFAERLTGEGLDDLVDLVDTNLFGMSVDPRLSAADHADLARLIELGQPMAVFIAPPPADGDPDAL